MNGRALIVIPARGGSHRLRGKNLRSLAGIPLVGWAARIAAAAAGPDDLVVCSTEDAAIASVARAWGVEVIDRPAELATDTASSVAVAVHALEVMGAGGHAIDLIALVQPTSPLTDPADLAAALATARRTGRSVVSVAPSHPAAWHRGRAADGTLQPAPTDDAPFLFSGGFYVTTPEALRRTGGFVEASVTLGHEVPVARAVDVDREEDLVAAAGLLRARSAPPFTIGGREVAAGRALVIAEAGVNHDGDPQLAHALIDAAADAGADAVKFQTFVAAALASPTAPTAGYQRDRDGGDTQRAMLERLVLPEDAWAGLQDHARTRGIEFLSTPFDDASADLLERLDVGAFKVGSGELTNLPFLARLAATGRPLIVSTGMATMPEVARAADAVRAAGDGPLALLHCVSSYPAAPEDANLAAIAMLREAFGVQAGWSDHTPGIELPVAAVALGATIVEKHLTLDRARRGPDHAMSLDPATFAAMVAAIRATEPAIGGHDKAPTAAEREMATLARRSLHWVRDLPTGTVVQATDLAAQRPGTGLGPAQAADLVGRPTARDVRAGEMVVEGDT